jgi:glycerophosphoryl diester phosphodiesterase
VIAHRGASGYRPEHTASAFLLAIDLGADAVEPDLVASRDGVLVIRHENEISTTTDVARHPEFADRRTTKTIDGVEVTGWFTEDFLWSELQTLGASERMPRTRPANTTYDGVDGLLCLDDLLDLLQGAPTETIVVVELKHPSYFAGIGLPLDVLLAEALRRRTALPRLIIESFELSVLRQVAARGVQATLTYLIEAQGAPVDRPLAPYAASLTDDGLAELATVVDGISVDKAILLQTDDAGRTTVCDLVSRAHAVGLEVFCWTLRAENRFLAASHRRAGAAHARGDWQAEFAMLMAAGIDGVFADQPDLAVEARRRWWGAPGAVGGGV